MLARLAASRPGFRDHARLVITEEWRVITRLMARDHGPGMITEPCRGGCARAIVRDQVPDHDHGELAACHGAGEIEDPGWQTIAGRSGQGWDAVLVVRELTIRL
jgi:hypothetical protein